MGSFWSGREAEKDSEGPLFGEFTCSNCRRHWKSRRTWSGDYQICKRCNLKVWPHTQRKLSGSDMTAMNNSKQDHPQTLCGKCLRQGSYCGSTAKNRRS